MSGRLAQEQLTIIFQGWTKSVTIQLLSGPQMPQHGTQDAALQGNICKYTSSSLWAVARK